ncbi:MAG: hypothetical protein ACM33V_07150 [Chloroflexota bacterium]|nr:hypothetical protein [Anaerolineales bacterium]
MSKKRRKQRHSKPFPWLPVALGGVLLVIVAFFFANRISDGGGTPTIKVNPQNIDYGYVKFGETKSFVIQVTNTGNGILRFKEKPYIEVLKGC